jgi:hypothetical protein
MSLVVDALFIGLSAAEEVCLSRFLPASPKVRFGKPADVAGQVKGYLQLVVSYGIEWQNTLLTSPTATRLPIFPHILWLIIVQVGTNVTAIFSSKSIFFISMDET